MALQNEADAAQARPPVRRNATWALVGQLAKLMIQMGYFVLVARVLKPDEYGAFVGVTALANAMSAFSGMGSGHILIRDISRDRERFGGSWGLALIFHFVFGLSLLIVLLCLAPWLLPAAAHRPMIVSVGLADLIFSRLIDLAFQSFQAVHDGRRMVFVQFVGSGTRLLGAIVLALYVDPKSSTTWSYLYLGASVLSGLFSVALVTRKIGRPTLAFGRLGPLVSDGFHFAMGQSAETIYNDIDKTMLSRISTLEAAAIYSISYRFVEAATVPIRALSAATYPVFFEMGVGGMQATYKLAKSLLPKSVAYGAAASLCLLLFSPLLTVLMGPAYAESSSALRWLCILPLLRSIHAFLLDALTGADRQGTRSLIQLGVAGANVLVNIWLIRSFGWKGASVSSILSDALLVICLEGAILFFCGFIGGRP